MERRLAAILAADMVGYSRLMEADERGTIARQKAHRAELIDLKITGIVLVVDFTVWRLTALSCQRAHVALPVAASRT